MNYICSAFHDSRVEEHGTHIKCKNIATRFYYGYKGYNPDTRCEDHVYLAANDECTKEEYVCSTVLNE